MKSILLLALCACATVAVRPDEGESKRQLLAQSDAWDKAIVRKDKAAIESNMSALFFQVAGDSSRQSREAFIADLVDPDFSIDPYTVDDLEVHLNGDTALLTGSTRMTGSYKGKPFASHYRYIDTYVREAGVWRIMAVQITPVP